ncbi:MAG: InlB B-repeat-containing protein, partial [Oscillospiraceae bacterium]|nr:InlB B-repeat-containing protein [Oscillospiraceae bacterium]
MKKYANKRLLAMLVVITMVIGLFPVNVLAASSGDALPTVQEEVIKETAPAAESNDTADNNGGQTGVSEGGGQQTDAADGDGQQTDVTDGDGQQTDVTDGDGQQTDVTDGDGQQTDVTEDDGEENELTETEDDPVTYTIKYIAGEGGTVSPASESVIVKAGESASASGSTAKASEGYRFVSWTAPAENNRVVSTSAFFAPKGVSANATYRANFEKAEVAAKAVNLTAALTAAETDGEGADGDDPDQEVVTREGEPGDGTYTVTFMVGDETHKSVTVNAGEAIGEQMPADPTPEEGYRFTGWDTDISSETVPTGNMTVNAQFAEVNADDETDETEEDEPTRDGSYTVTFQVNGELYEEITVNATEAIGEQMPADPTPEEGYRFTGWDPAVSADTVPEDNMTVNAQFEEIVMITVTFNPNTEPEGELAPLTIQVEQGETIGSQLPTVPTVPGYITKWVDGEGTEVTADTVVNEPFTAVVGREKIVYTVTFVQEDGTEETRTADIDTGFAINELPEVAPKTNKIGKWVYQGTTDEFTVGTIIDSDLTVEAYYEQNIFTVTFKAEGYADQQFTTAKGTTIILPTDPVKTGCTFVGWFTEPDGEGTQYTASSTVSEDLTLYAFFAEQVRVSFLVKDDEGNVITSKSQYFIDLTAGDQITTMPDDPFMEGKVFDHWENETNGETVDIGYTVEDSFNAVAVFTPITAYELTVRYYYMNGSNEVEIGTRIYELVGSDLEGGYSVTAPQSAVADEITGKPLYYPTIPTITVTTDGFNGTAWTLDTEKNVYKLTVDDEYVDAHFPYTVNHYLQDLDGSDYTTLIESESKEGVANTAITPEAKNYAYADYDHRDENVELSGENVVANVYYTRRNFTLSYNVSGGDYIEAVTAPYGTQITLPTDATRAGYTFDGWFTDSACTQAASSPFTLEENTTLYAKWTPAQSDYKIVYMIENANDDGYSYLATVTKQAETGSSITMTAQTAGADGTRPSELDTTNFTFKDSTTETVLADGTTVVTVRYSRNVYTITWEGSGYEDFNPYGSPIPATWHTGRGRATLTAKYGADISAQWAATFNTPHPNWAWNFNGRANNFETFNRYNDEKFTSLDIMPSGNRTVYHWVYTTNKTQTLNYWFENYDSETTTTRNGRTYGLFKSVTVHYNYLYASDYPDYAGYTQAGWVRSDGARNLTDGTPNGRMTADFYYNALQYPLTFYNYDGTLISTQQVTLNADISSYLSSNVPEPPMEGATWLGWFTDAEHTSAYAGGTKMPTGLVLYGDFQFPTRTVSFDTNGGSANPESQTDEYGFLVTQPDDPTRDGYVFQGWFTAADETGSPYDWNKKVEEDFTLYAHWKQKTLSYTVHYYEWDSDNDAGTTNQLLPDKVMSNPDYIVGQSITENAQQIPGYVVNVNSITKELTFHDEENVFIFYYSNIPDELTYTVNYVLRDHPEIKVAESKTVTVPGTTTNAMEMAVEVDTEYLATQTSDEDILRMHYKPTETSKELELALEGNVITFEYVPYTTVKITVNYLDMDGNVIHDPETSYVEKGDTYTVMNQAPDGFVYHHAYLDGTTTAAQSVYQINGDEGDLVINIYYQKKLIIIANNKSKTYDGTALASDPENASDYTITGIARGDTVTGIEFDGSQTDAGTSATTPKNAVIELGDTNNVAPEEYYSVVYVPGSLTVKPVSVYISISADQWNTHSGGTGGPNYYTGQVFNVGFTNPNKQQFNDASGSAYVNITSGQRDLFKNQYGDAIWSALYGANGALISEKDAGTYTVAGAQQTAIIAGVTVGGQNIMSDPNYSVKIFARDCFLVIEPLPLTITTPSDTKAYDGTALTKEEGATLDHSYWTANIGGEWTAAETAAPGSVTLGTGDTITFEVTGSQTPVGSSDNTYSIDWGDVDPGNYVISETLGTLTVTKGELTVTVKDIEKPYNGSEQEGRPFAEEVTGTGETIDNDDYTVEGLGNGDILTITYTPAKGTEADTYDNGFFEESYTIVNADGEDVTGNYESISFTSGKLTITRLTITINITGHNDTQPYTGEEQTATGFDAECDSELFDESHVFYNGDPTAARTYLGKTDMGLEEEKFSYEDKNITANFNVGEDGYMEITQVYVTLTINKTWLKPADEDAPDVSFTVAGGPEDKTATIASGESSVNVSELPVATETGVYSYTVTETVPDGYKQTEAAGDTSFKAAPNGSYTASFTNQKAEATYIVEYYYQNDDGTYPDAASATSDPRTGNTGEKVSVTADDKADKEGGKYTYDSAANNVESATLAADGSTVLKLYFKLNDADYTVEFYYQDENLAYQKADELTDTRTATIGQTVEATDEDKAKTTYNGETFTLNEGESTLSATMALEGTVLKLYFDLEVEAELTVTKTADPTSGVAVDDEITYTIEVENTGNVTISDLVLEDILEGIQLGELDKTTIAPGETATATATYVVTQADVDAGQIDNTATATGKDPADEEVTGEDDCTVTTEEANASIAVTKTADPASDVNAGDTITYTVVVTNTGNVSVTDGTLEDDHADLSGETFALAPEEEATFTYTYEVTEEDFEAGEIVNVVKANATAVRGADPEEVEATATVTAADAESKLSITKEADPTSDVAVGDTITYTVVVTNTGNVSVKDGTLDDDHADLSGETFALAPEEDATFTYTYEVTQADFDAGEIVNVVKANATAARGDDPEEVEATATVTAAAAESELSITKEADLTEVDSAGTIITYTVTVKNEGNVTVKDGTLEDDHADLSGKTFTLAPGEEASFTYTYKVTQADMDSGTGEIVNVVKANATAARGDDPDEVEATATVKIIMNGHITVTKGVTSTPANGSSYALGETIMYSVTVTNDGNLTITDITVTDELTGDTWKIASLA